MDNEIILACEGLRIEMDHLAAKMLKTPEIVYMPQGLHSYPEKMQNDLNLKIAEIEDSRPDIDIIILGYGLCGRGLCGVQSKRVKMIIPKVHDCIPLYLGLGQKDADLIGKNSGVFWLCAGMMEVMRLGINNFEIRYETYAKKYGEKYAERMIKAENAMFSVYKAARFVRWSELDKKYYLFAKIFAKEVGLPLEETKGSPDYLLDLLHGGLDEEKFLHIKAGCSIDMDTYGNIILIDH